jgi:hypothetical protein
MSSTDALLPPLPPLDWDSLGEGEIYDRFTKKGANEMLREMVKKALLTSSVGMLLCKGKDDRDKKRLFFANLSAPGLHFLSVQMNQFSRPPGDGDDENGDE